MLTTIKISPVNSLLFVSDIGGGTPPEPVWGAKILSTPSCISFACFPEQDGPTVVTVGSPSEITPGPLLVFEGLLETPRHTVVLETAEHERVLSMGVASAQTKVRIWYSHPKWPDKVTIGLS